MVGLQKNAEKTESLFVCFHKHTGKNHNIKTTSNFF